MHLAKRDDETRKRARWSLALLAASVCGVGLLGAAPAQAEDEFGHGFKDELGRIAAQQVFFVGKAVWTGAFEPVAAPARYDEHRHVEARPAPYRYWRDEPPRRAWREETRRQRWRERARHWRQRYRDERASHQRHHDRDRHQRHHDRDRHRHHGRGHDHHCDDESHGTDLSYRLERWERRGPGYSERYVRRSRW